MNHPFIEIKSLGKSYNGNITKFNALQDINLNIEQGAFILIVGKSGCGKSTLLNLLTGIDRPSNGEIKVGNIPIHSMKNNELAIWRGKNAGIVFQFFQLLPNLTLLENVMLPMEFAGIYNTHASRKERAIALLKQVELNDHIHKFPQKLSGGEKQRAAIARALANNPQLITADEPTGNLDTQNSEMIHQLFNKLSAEGKTIVYVTHEKELSINYHRKITLADGSIISQIENLKNK